MADDAITPQSILSSTLAGPEPYKNAGRIIDDLLDKGWVLAPVDKEPPTITQYAPGGYLTDEQMAPGIERAVDAVCSKVAPEDEPTLISVALEDLDRLLRDNKVKDRAFREASANVKRLRQGQGQLREELADARQAYRDLETAHARCRATDQQPLNRLATDIHHIAADHGFWDADRNFGEMLMLATSELAEALEEHRAGRPVVWYKHADDCSAAEFQKSGPAGQTCHGCMKKPEGAAVEIADCIIRCLDTMASLDVDIDDVVAEKIAYNRSRPHKHGKAY